jgi:phosphoglycerate dehydrogenase-like enzyme
LGDVVGVAPFRVGITPDLMDLQRSSSAGLEKLFAAEPAVVCDVVSVTESTIDPGSVRDLDALLVLKPRVMPSTLAGADRLSLVARWGVGHDNIDVDECTRLGVAVTLTPDGVRRPMAVAMLSLLLALATNLAPKHEMMRRGHWDRMAHMGTGLSGRTLGLIGMGNIGVEFLTVAQPLGMRFIAYDPFRDYAPPGLGVEMAELESVLGESDFLCVCCPLTPDTRHLLNAERLSLMKPSASLLNAARGAIIQEEALVEALERGRLRAVGLDVFEEEPLSPDSSLRRCDNAILSPHSLGWTDELVTGNGASSTRAVLDAAHGLVPEYVLNREVLGHVRQERSRQARKQAGGTAAHEG